MPTFGRADGRGWWSSVQEDDLGSRSVRFKDSWRTSNSPKLAFIPFNPPTGQYMQPHPITHLSISSIPSPRPLISHPSISLSLLSVMEHLFTEPHMRCRQCKINDLRSTFKEPALLAELVHHKQELKAHLSISIFIHSTKLTEYRCD